MRQDADRAKARALFQSMTAREKWNHLVRYYWFHVLATLAVLIVAVTFVVSWRDSIARQDCVYFGIQEGYAIELEEPLEQLARQEGWPEPVNLLTFPSITAEDGMGSMQLVLYLSADELDFALCDQETMGILLEDESYRCSALPLTQTRLGEYSSFADELFLVTFHDTARGEKVSDFDRLLRHS